MALPKILKFRDDLDKILQQIRHERQILPPVYRCRHGGAIGRAAEPRVSVRALILAAARFKITSPEMTKQIEKDWVR